MQTSTSKEINLETNLIPFTKINSKLIINLNVKCKTIKLLGDNIGGNLGDLGFGDTWVLDTTPKTWSMKDIIGKPNFVKIKNFCSGLPWWRSGWESACQCREHGFEPWSGKIPHAAEQLDPWATSTEPARLEPVLRNKRGRDSERPAHRDEGWPPLAATRESPRMKRRPNTAKNK